VTYNPDFKITVIQREITRKSYSIELYLRYDRVYLTCSKKLTGSQLSLLTMVD